MAHTLGICRNDCRIASRSSLKTTNTWIWKRFNSYRPNTSTLLLLGYRAKEKKERKRTLQWCFTSIETIKIIGDGKPRTATSTLHSSWALRRRRRRNNRKELCTEPRSDLKREVELGSHSELDCRGLEEALGSSSWSFGLCLRDISAQLLKEQVAESTTGFALAGSPPP